MKAKLLGTLLALAVMGAAATVSMAQTPPPAPADTTAAQPTTPPPPPPATPAPAAPKNSGPSRIYYGGTATFSFGSTTSIGIFPMIGYKLTPKISGGVEAGYEHVSYGDNQSSDNYGGSVFGRLRVGRNLYGHAEYQTMNYEIFTPTGSERQWIPAVLLGGGYIRSLGRTSVYGEVLFDVLQDDDSPYSDWEPIVTFGVAVGF